jgi:hypothetical protein
MVLTLPIRFEAVMTAGVSRKRVIRKVVRRHGRRKRVRRRVVRLLPRARVRLGRSARIAGRLTNPDGQPIAGATIYVLSRSVGSAQRLAGAVSTDSEGRYSYRAKASESRVVTLAYLGTRLIRPTTRDVGLLVPAASTLRTNRHRVRNGRSVVFRGRVRSLPAPVGGKLVEVQAFFRHRWRTISTVRSKANGRWRFRYRFGGTRGLVTYRFRVRLPREGGYPFETGTSRAVRIAVRGP